METLMLLDDFANSAPHKRQLMMKVISLAASCATVEEFEELVKQQLSVPGLPQDNFEVEPPRHPQFVEQCSSQLILKPR